VPNSKKFFGRLKFVLLAYMATYSNITQSH
jgi:hypothetical protein